MKYAPKMGDQTKQVRVDNWGTFFLQRLQTFFSKTDYCDMTLQFDGNVQLKVHRLVMNACTDYFQMLEQSCSLDDNVVLMPADLQADVIVPIVNFMYTGMLEFHLSIFEKLYKTAQMMNITILIKLLDAQKQSMGAGYKGIRRKHVDSPVPAPVSKKSFTKSAHGELPATLPGRKLPIWKRKTVSSTSQMHSSTPHHSEQRWNAGASDPLAIDNVPKPTRFEWPDDDLPTLPMDTSFEEISLTSKPLLTLEEDSRASTSFDDIRHTPNASRAAGSSKRRSSPSIDMEEVKNYVKEQKIRSGFSQEEENVDNDLESVNITSDTSGSKRKADIKLKSIVTKKVRFEEQENKTTTISIATDAANSADLDHQKIVSEILKKYPQLVKKNKNIRLKIMTKNNKTSALEPSKSDNIVIKSKKTNTSDQKKKEVIEEKAPWVCNRCSTEDEPMEFVLYYLYRKHMTDVHNEKIDSKLCKYCGHRCNKQNLLMYHLYTKHGIKPASGFTFPKCDQCPYIALSSAILAKHLMRHDKDEIQCMECKLTFTSQTTLTSHMQITGHTGKSPKNNYDCQYCTKKYQSGINLFSHLKMQHRNEAIRDGIVSIDEADEIEDYDESDDNKDEYILPEIIASDNDLPVNSSTTTSSSSKKVNILSNVKVQDRLDAAKPYQIPLEPSSEAEALNNVASGIATSLGLVDIVVLNENQQLFLQTDDQNYTTDQSESTEFILPELTAQNHQGEVISTDGVITQSMITSGDIGSTDELVMVLTDHDYGDNQEEINNDNSNIVVLYSHPVDGQQDQFITTQGNVMVNSQTGLIEIRNGALTSQESHIESIEMIQREIESHGSEINKDTLYDNKETTDDVGKEIEQHLKGPIQSDSLVETLVQGQQLEFSAPSDDLEASSNNVAMIIEESHGNENQECSNKNDNENIEKESEESVEMPPPTQEEVDDSNQQENEEEEQVIINENNENGAIISEETAKNKQDNCEEGADNQLIKDDETISQQEMQEAETEEQNQGNETETTDQDIESEQPPESASGSQEDDEDRTECEEKPNENYLEEKIQEELSVEQDFSQSDTSTSQFLDDNSQSSHGSHRKDGKRVSTKISILDDWEDTDSQQSNPKAEKGEETVNKLMDDWEDEEEDNKDE